MVILMQKKLKDDNRWYNIRLTNSRPYAKVSGNVSSTKLPSY